MTAGGEAPLHETPGAWAKRLYFAARATMDAVLRPYDLGSSQWYVLYQLANVGPTMQRDLVEMLHVEKASLSSIVATLVRKGLIEQTSDPADQRQRLLRLTALGLKLWKELPDPITLIQTVAFDGMDRTDLETAVRVLKTATERLNNRIVEGDKA